MIAYEVTAEVDEALTERHIGYMRDRQVGMVAALKAGQPGGGDKRGMQSAPLLVVRKNGGYLGTTDRFSDIRVSDAKDPIAELERLLALHKLHFFPSEPVNQPTKWLAAPEAAGG